ncbi:hypothetical protein H5123_20090 [Shewanella sp. SR43-4]|uniref:hypothetical protein n=1 Tax=Shewanella sp. SR43-4 TaxID=2760942 RepID=UPI0015FBC8A6|nr:hypothetical protein [Shewanella sp. SR43-4]MBB1319925.1 hypothetical protein [Shewanella sp. SR43-4]
MDSIQLQSKTKALKGSIEAYWFENENIGLENTQFHRISIPLEPFDSGLDYEEQPVKTEIILDWYKLGISSPDDLDGLNLKHESYPDAEGSIYVGTAHNWCDVKKLEIFKIEDASFCVVGEIYVEFENEGVAKNELFKFETNVVFSKA